MLASSSLVLMGSGIGAVRVPDILQAATDALRLAGSANLRIDVTELPLAQVEKAWVTDYDRSRVVFTI